MSKSDRRRNEGKKPQEKRFLVVLEGRVTEHEYIYAAVPRLNKRNVMIRTSRDTGHTDPVGIVNTAKQLRLEAKKTEPYDKGEVWCVFDVEAKRTQTSRERLAEAVDSADHARGGPIELAISNPCFEIWLLWHKERHHAELYSNDAQRRCEELEITQGKDSKHIQSVSELVRDFYYAAKEMAFSMKQEHNRNGKTRPEEMNPSSGVYLLIDAIYAAFPTRG